MQPKAPNKARKNHNATHNLAQRSGPKRLVPASLLGKSIRNLDRDFGRTVGYCYTRIFFLLRDFDAGEGRSKLFGVSETYIIDKHAS